MEELEKEELIGTEGGACECENQRWVSNVGPDRIDVYLGPNNYNYEDLKITNVHFSGGHCSYSTIALTKKGSFNFAKYTKYGSGDILEWVWAKNNLIRFVRKSRNIERIRIQYQENKRRNKNKKRYGF